MQTAKNIMSICDHYRVATVNSLKTVSPAGILSGVGGVLAAIVAGAANYTNIYTPTDFSAASGGFQDAFAFLLDCLTGMGNWYVTNAMGQLYIGMACLMFVFILIKSLFRHSGGKRR